MARNIEIKARLDSGTSGSIDALLPRALAIADGPPEAIAQDDTFFGVGSSGGGGGSSSGKSGAAGGRLKLRVFRDGSAELISYRRADAAGPKLSAYVRAPVADPAALRRILGHALGEAGRVVKQRTLIMAGRIRIHLDRVVGLGEFLELEVVLTEGEDAATGVAEAEALLAQLGIRADQLVSGAYVDLLREAQAAPEAPEAPEAPKS